MVSQVSPALIVQNQFPARSVRELIAIAQAKPGQLNHASVATGSMGHLGALLLRSMAKIDFTQVLYKGSPQALNALLSGEVQFYLIGSVGTAVAHIKTGRIRALGVGASQRIAALPDVPTIAETLPGYEARGWNAIFAPARTPKPVIDRLNRKVEIGYWLGKSFRGRGVMTDACREVVRYSFRELELNRVEIRCAAGNRASRAIPSRLGFTHEATLKEAQLLYGTYHDLEIWSVLRKDFRD